MEALRIFVASSTEGEPIAKELRNFLQEELGDGAVVEMWRSKFTFGETTIESLEAVAEEADFALMVMTPDDITVSRDEKSAAPRDNLVFELGLFVGALGRNRAIVVRDSKKSMKLPSDYLNVTVLSYDSSSAQRQTTSLQTKCVKLAGYIKKVGLRPKWLAQGKAALAANADFCREVEGLWYQRINYPEGSALSVFTITTDTLTCSLELEGTGYGKDGKPSALWRSEMTRLYPAERRIAYLWRGSHPLPGRAQLKFHGYGSMDFKSPERPSSQLTCGTGDFWDVDEVDPAATVFKPTELRRVTNKNHRQIMISGTAKQKSELVLRVLKAW